MKEEEEAIKQKFELMAGNFNERTRRQAAAAEAMALGWGGISVVARATGISHRVIRQGIRELEAGEALEEGRIRRPGGGRKKAVSKDIGLHLDLILLAKPVRCNNSTSPTLWTSKSLRKLAAELEELGHNVSHQLVSDLLHDMGYSYRPNPKLYENIDERYRFSGGGFVWHP